MTKKPVRASEPHALGEHGDLREVRTEKAPSTPGPWVCEDLSDGDIGIRVAGPVVSGYTATVYWRWVHENQQAEQKANARLIAAAPDLYAALRTILGCDETDPHGIAYFAFDADSDVAVKARAAIAKAEGR